MFYFFERDSEFVRCEVSGDDESGYTITITEPGGHERTEQFASSVAAHARWLALQSRFQDDGWWGPVGRD